MDINELIIKRIQIKVLYASVVQSVDFVVAVRLVGTCLRRELFYRILNQGFFLPLHHSAQSLPRAGLQLK